MGIDCVIAFQSRATLSPKEVAHLQGRLRDAMGYGPAEIGIGEARERFGPCLEVETSWRYYGQYYERGPWVQIRAVLSWLLANVDGSVYYLNDSCDELTAPIDASDIARIDAHWFKHGEIPYRTKTGNPMCPTCDLPTGVSMYAFGLTEFRCRGCDYAVTANKDGALMPHDSARDERG